MPAVPEDDERELVRRMLAGDERSFDAFFDRYFPRLFRFAARRVAREEDAEDIVQAAMVTAIRKLASWRGEAALFTWLCTICRREVAARWRRTARTPELRALDDDPEIRGQLEALAADVEGPEHVHARRELAERVQVALDYLPARYGDVLEWKYIAGLSVAEIAARLDSTPKAVESMLSRARDAFREGFNALAEPRS